LIPRHTVDDNLPPAAAESPYINRQFKLESSAEEQAKQTKTIFCLDLSWKKGLHKVKQCLPVSGNAAASNWNDHCGHRL